MYLRLVVVGVGVLGLGWPSPLRAAGVVGDCTEQGFRAALAGGGEVTFDKDCAITLSAPITIATNTTVDAVGHGVTINGSSTGRLFNVAANVNFTLAGLTLRNGQSTNGGALYINPGAGVRLTRCTLSGNRASGTTGTSGANGANSAGIGGNGGNGAAGGAGLGGAIYNLGSLTLSNCLVVSNLVAGGVGGNGGNGGNGGLQGGNGGGGGAGGLAYGGAVYNLGALALRNSSFSGNQATGGNGGFGGTNGSGAFAGLAGVGAAGA